MSPLFYFAYLYYSLKNKLPANITIEDIIKATQICSHIPLMGNIAFPDNSSIYLITFLHPNIEININLNNINTKQYNLFSITVYNTSGKIIFYYDKDIIYKKQFKTKDYCAVIIRIYSENSKHVFEELTKKYDLNISQLKKATQYFEYYYKGIISLRRSDIISSCKCFQFSKHPISIFFPNFRAKYLVYSININEENVIVIEATKPKCGVHLSFRYFGYMICNLKTTETDHSVGYYNLSDKYILFVAKTRALAEKKGYLKDNKKHVCLTWNKTNDTPIIVYREIRVDQKGIFSLTNSASPQQIHEKMGIYYPKITAIF